MYMIETSAIELLVPLYNSPQRHYHDINHIYYCLSKLSEYMTAIAPEDTHGHGLKSRPSLIYAIWFHDAIYSPFPFSDSSNEKESGNLFSYWARANTAKSPEDIRDIHNLIRATEFHLEESNSNTKQKVMLDVDMAGFAKPFAEVLEDNNRIFREYAPLGLPHKVMLNNRITFLDRLLQKDRIYRTEYFHDTHEKSARDNIKGVLELSRFEYESI